MAEEKIPIKKVCLVGYGFMKGTKERRIWIPPKKFSVRVKEEDYVKSLHLLKYITGTAYFSYDPNAKTLEDVILSEDELSGEQVHIFGAEPYSWRQTVTDGLIKGNETERLIGLIREMKDVGNFYEERKKALGDLNIDSYSLFGQDLEKFKRQDFCSPNYERIRRMICKLAKAISKSGIRSLEGRDIIKRYLSVAGEFTDLHEEAFGLFNKVWRRRARP